MKAKLTVNGKEFDVDISEEQAKELTESKKTGFEKTNRGNKYFTIRVERGWCTETNEKFDNDVYSSGRYFNDIHLCDDYIRVIKLFLKLSQWQAFNDAPANNKACYTIDVWCGEIMACITTSHQLGLARFSTQEKAEEAIEVFRNDLEWYFKEFKPRLDM